MSKMANGEVKSSQDRRISLGFQWFFLELFMSPDFRVQFDNARWRVSKMWPWRHGER